MSVAKAEVGYHEGRSGGHWNNHQKYSPAVPGLEWSQNQAWCATFVSWAALQAGESAHYPRTASCATGVNWFRNKGRWSAYPAVGAQVFFGNGGGSHTEICYAYDADYAYTVGGNTNTNGSAEGDGVYLRKRARRDSYLYGYGYPDVAGGSVSADPDASKFGYKHKATGDVGDVGGSTTPDKPAEPSGAVARYKVTINGLEYGYGARGAQVTQVGKALVAKGFGDAYKDGPGPNWSDADTTNYAAFQRSLGYSGKDADGVPGEGSLTKLLGKLPAKAKPKPSYEPFPGAAWFKKNPKSPIVTAMGKRLVAEGCSAYRSGPGAQWTNADKASYAKWQRKRGYSGADADGWPGKTTWDALKVPKV
ncbi:gp50 [Lomovskayavirus C31]|uniref:Gp50 n=1 Tax=Streptomyces phage phiC31 TaxID=10719 RepID=Q9ZX99_BPPHC|nr:endolysin [Lomovskayavirus C31]CAA07120.2 gp50 [Lomovskayavirus C31]